MKRSVKELEILAGLTLTEAADKGDVKSPEQEALKKKIFDLNKKGKNLEISSLLKDINKKSPKLFNDALDFFVSISK